MDRTKVSFQKLVDPSHTLLSLHIHIHCVLSSIPFLELDSLRVRMYFQIHYAWGRKRRLSDDEHEDHGVTNPPLPGHDMPSRESGQIFLRAEDAEVIQDAQRTNPY